MVRPRVFMDFVVNEEVYGRVVFELFADTAPKTCEKFFRSLCTGERGISASGNILYYKNSIVHRSIKGFMIQGGDFSKRNGTGGESIYGGTFLDEDLQRPIDRPALLCMANKGPNTNGSQFFITLEACPHLNGKHVVFGHVIKGFKDVVLRLAEVPVDEKDRPGEPISIMNCGELELRKRKRADVHPPSDRKLKKNRSRRDSTPDSNNSQQKNSDYVERKVETSQHKEQTQETEEEYDARLEREEAERLDQDKKRALVRIRETYGDSSRAGVRYKGRGRMKYIDPEHHRY